MGIVKYDFICSTSTIDNTIHEPDGYKEVPAKQLATLRDYGCDIDYIPFPCSEQSATGSMVLMV